MDRTYLLVFAGDSAQLVPLADGWLRRCARGLEVTDTDRDALLRFDLTGETRVTPVPGGPSVAVNDAAVDREARLTSGDVLTVGDLRAVFHRDPRVRPSRRVLGGADLTERLAQEAERARRYKRPLAVLVVPLPRGADELDVSEQALEAVRRSDVVGFTSAAELVVLFPEVGESAAIPARRLVAALGARGGLALLPADGDDPDALLTGARRAAAAAREGDIARVSDATDHVDVGDATLVTVDPKMRGLLGFARDLARSDLPILVTGETGAGKDLVARALHAWSPRNLKRFVAFNCAALSESLIESELFGHRAGAFSGATGDRVGLLESAAGGTVFLDEVGECSPRLQAELLRVLENGVVRPVGATAERRVDLRFVAATNRDLDAESRAGKFRRDLYFRLSAARLEVPPLRERPLDVPALARHFLAEACASLARPAPVLSDEVLLRLESHDWPGNVRELRNLMRLLAAVVRGDGVDTADLPPALAAPWRARRDLTPPADLASFRPLGDEIRDLERRRIAQALAASGGVRVKAAALIGMPLRTFACKIKELGLDGAPLRRSA